MICGTRYGNVMASRGSVIPLFVEQILAGEPITITDPAMTRFMMTLDECGGPGAVRVPAWQEWRHLRAEGTGRHGRRSWRVRLSRCMGVPIIEIVEIGTRHGEKLYETLLSREEMSQRRRSRRILPRPGRWPRPELREIRRGRRAAYQFGTTTTIRTTPASLISPA